ncbi:MAG: hypothetical protein QF391_11060, partial [Myxococcota bacterium]|nr:hypothetical protein [Myxococcota bacterium]
LDGADDPDFELRQVDFDDLDFELAGVWGRNWAGYLGGLVPAPLMRVIDHALRPFPTLCSDIYVVGRKPAG